MNQSNNKDFETTSTSMANNLEPTPPHGEFSALLRPDCGDSGLLSPLHQRQLEEPSPEGSQGRSSPNTTTSTASSTSVTMTAVSRISELHRFTPRLPSSCPRVQLAPKKAKSPNSAECCMNPKRVSSRVLEIPGTRVFVDCCNINRTVVERLKKKGVLLKLNYNFRESKESILGKVDPPPTGQAGIVKDHRGRAHLITAQHNVSNFFQIVGKDNNALGHYFEFVEACAVVEGSDRELPVDFEHQSIEQSKIKPLKLTKFSSWKHGWDVTTGPVIDFPSENQTLWRKVKTSYRSPWYKPWQRQVARLSYSASILQEAMLEMARPDFLYQVGQCVAMVVSSVGLTETATPKNVDSTWTNEIDRLSQHQCDIIYGPPGVVSIYTGKITKVHDHHLEHDINTYEGCSGGLLVLLDCQDQLTSVLKGDLDKAIALHVGYDDLAASNIALKINKGPKKPAWSLPLPKLNWK